MLIHFGILIYLQQEILKHVILSLLMQAICALQVLTLV